MKYRYLQIVLFIAGITFNYYEASAQESIYFPDSVISYTLRSMDTSSKVPTTKTINKYSKEFKLQERQLFHWNRNENKWQKDQRFELHYYPTETLVEVYSYDGLMKETHKGRIIIKMNPQLSNITQVSALIKDKTSEKYTPWKQIDFEYRKDTCISMKQMQKGSTFYVGKESKLEKINGGYSLKTKFYSEIGKKEIGEEIISYLFSNKILKTIQYKSNVNDTLKYRDSLSYQKNKVDYIRHTYLGSKSKHFIQWQNYITKVVYSPKGYPSCQLTYIENKNGQKIQDQLNGVEYWYCNQLSPIVKKSYFKPQIDDQLQLLNEIN